MRVLVSWHRGSIGYVTQVVDQHTGAVLHQTPPDEVLALVLKPRWPRRVLWAVVRVT